MRRRYMMQLYFKVDEFAGQGRYILIENKKILDNIISCFSGLPKKVIKALRELEAFSCCACLAVKMFAQEGVFYRILEVGILNPNNFKEGNGLTEENVVYVHPNAEFNVLWDEILMIIDNSTGEMDRIINIIQ